MRRAKPIVAKDAGELADILGFSPVDEAEMQFRIHMM
jgi:hypothetical protein